MTLEKVKVTIVIVNVYVVLQLSGDPFVALPYDMIPWSGDLVEISGRK